MKCRICKSENLTKFLDLGKQPLADAFLTKEQLSQSEAVYPLEVFFCNDCTLVQLGYIVPPEVLYNDDYPYETGMNTEGVSHFRELAKTVVSKFDLKYSDLVVDIGSNDGTLLEGFQELGCKVLGIEPVKKIADKAKVPTINKFFGSDVVKAIGKKAKIITATNVFAHIDDLHGFIFDIKLLLADDGVFIIEVPFLADMINKLAFDTIYHEHLSYFSAEPLQALFEMHNMKIINADWQPVHSGTMRYYVGKMPQPSYLLRIGEKFTLSRLNQFAENVVSFRQDLVSMLDNLKHHGNSIVGVSAPAKGNTLLNYCGINGDILDYITEKSPKKIGRYTPGTHIEIVPDERIVETNPDYAVILAWNWSKPIIKHLRKIGYKGEFIIPNEAGIKNISFRGERVSRVSDSKRA